MMNVSTIRHALGFDNYDYSEDIREIDTILKDATKQGVKLCETLGRIGSETDSLYNYINHLLDRIDELEQEVERLKEE